MAVASCRPPTNVYVQAPVARYDHNRSRPLCVVTTDEPAPCSPAAGAGAAPVTEAPKLKFGSESYAPQSVYPYHLQYVQGGAASDSLPPAQLVPIYTGVALPLSAAPIPGCPVCVPDRKDLTDYLASGPGVFVGVDTPDMQGDVTSTAAQARPVLDLLSRHDVTTLTREQLVGLLKTLDLKTADHVFDSRYPSAAIVDVLAFRWDAFWFVLYRFPAPPGFTRLVVVPTGLAQDPISKRPTSELLPQERPMDRGNR